MTAGDLPQWAWLVVAAAGVLSAAVVLLRVLILPTLRLGLELRELLQDIRGTPDRGPGRPARPGLVEALAVMQASFEAHREHMAETLSAYLVEQERTRQLSHQEAAELWHAVAELAARGGMTIGPRPRRPDARTRADDPIPEQRQSPEEQP